MMTAGLWTGRRRMAAAATAAALAGLLLARPGPGATTSACPTGATTVSRGQSVPLSGSAPKTVQLCLAGSLTGALLDVRVKPANGSVDLELDAADGSYLRSSRIGAAGAWQRVALANPTATSYQFTVNPAGPAMGLLSASVPFTGSVSLLSVPSVAASSFRAPVVLPKSGDGEPSIAVDRANVDPNKRDTVLVTAPVGIPSAFNPIATGNGPGGIDYWRCDAHAHDCLAGGGSNFDYQNISLGDGGGDSHVVVDGAGGVYFADLAAANVNLLKSTDEGKTASQLPPTGNTTADREWMASYLPDKSKGTGSATLHVAYHDFLTQELWECSGSSGGTFPEPCVPIIPQNHPDIFGTGASNTIIGPQVLGADGTIYLPFGTSTPEENLATGGAGAIDHLYMGVSKDGNNWNAYPVVTLKNGSTTANIFPVATVDSAGTVYVAWSQQNAGPKGSPTGPIKLMLSRSLDKGATKWAVPVQVNPGPVGSAVLPWIAAAGPGQVDVAYVGSTTTANPDDALANWYVYLARTGNATAATPSFTTLAAAPNPVRYGQVCVSGIACATQGDDGRSLLDFISVDLDSHGCAVVAIPSSANQSAYQSKANLVTQTLVSKQTAGCFASVAAAVKPATPVKSKKQAAAPKKQARHR